MGSACHVDTFVSTEDMCKLASSQLQATYRKSVNRGDRPEGCYWQRKFWHIFEWQRESYFNTKLYQTPSARREFGNLHMWPMSWPIVAMGGICRADTVMDNAVHHRVNRKSRSVFQNFNICEKKGNLAEKSKFGNIDYDIG